MTPKLYKPSPVEAANKIVAELDKCNVNVYITLAKAALWIVAGVLLMLVVAGVALLSRYGFDVGTASVVVQACQVAVVVAITVLGWHGYKGSRVLHILRNWGGKD